MAEEITLEDLRKYQSIKENLKAIQMELNALYYPVSSVPMTSDGSTRSSLPSSPTERAFFRIEAKKARLEAKQAELDDLIDRIDAFIDDIEDHHVAAIMRMHFVVGKSWRVTCMQIYGYPDPDICRMAVRRYMEKRYGKNNGQ